MKWNEKQLLRDKEKQSFDSNYVCNKHLTPQNGFLSVQKETALL